ncbi:MAG TPA: hypothetical protein VM754_03935 [Actinomycetota bacterium]|jgi:hypothetical protein|nr:hypothetical protein [Actinomycetota bacterium]
MEDMDQEIRENAGDRMQDNISNQEGTKKWGNLENNPDGTSAGGASELPDQPQQEFPRASEEDVMEAGERAKAQFGGTYGGGGGVEAEADESIAQGGPPTGEGEDSKPAPSGPGAVAAGASAPSDQEQAEAQDQANQVLAQKQAETDSMSDKSEGEKFASVLKGDESSDEGDALTTGQKMAGIMSGEPGMKWESKLADAVSGGDDENT